MRDFTADTLLLLLSSMKSAGYSFRTVAGYLHDPATPAVILRHDVDARPLNSLKCAEMEYRLGIAGTYYFRTTGNSFNETVIRDIHNLGHETGYHYEDLATVNGDQEKAIYNFAMNLAKLRQVVPVETICMHGSPLSKYDNRQLWEKYDYRNFGITGEPYLDVDFRKVLYLTDTGRRWNGEKVSIRDRVIPEGKSEKKIGEFLSTGDIIRAAGSGALPQFMMITLHPQRWDNRLIPWTYELVWQNTKNVVKRFLTTFNG